MPKIHNKQQAKILNKDKTLLFVHTLAFLCNKTVVFKQLGARRPVGPLHPLQGRLMRGDTGV